MVEITPGDAIRYMKISVKLLSFWPPNKNASSREKILFHIYWCILWLICITLAIPCTYSAYLKRKDMIFFTKALTEALGCYHCAIKMVICQLQFNRMQVCIFNIFYYMYEKQSLCTIIIMVIKINFCYPVFIR